MNKLSISTWARCHIRLRRAAYPLLPVIAAIGALSIAITPPALANPPLTVSIHSCAALSAAVTGFVDHFPGTTTGTMRQFLGIRYARPPTGANRWQPPSTYCWNGNRNTQSFGSSCPQGSSLAAWMSEDCLTLNVFTRPTGNMSNRPVMVFIPGGAFIAGGSSFYNPISLVDQGVIVVTINYRIGALGFLAHPALDKVSTKNTGNYGILDQQAALKWVKANIAKFGGNPNNVTIFGQSAGGHSVLIHLLSPLSKNLFHKAILQSGPIYFDVTLADAEAQGQTFAADAGCASQKASCLRALSVDAILAKQGVLGCCDKLIRVDQVVLKDSMKNLLMAGKFQKVPIINGTTHDEDRASLLGDQTLGNGGGCDFKSKITPANYSSFLPSYFFAAASAVGQNYPPGGTDQSANGAFFAALTDRRFACHALHMDMWIAQNGGQLYAYEFNDPNAPPSLAPIKLDDGTIFRYRAAHATDLQYIFPQTGSIACGLPYAGLSPAQKKLATAMVTYWTTFAKTGNPNPTSGTIPPHWAPYQVTGSQMLSLVPAAPKAITASSFDTDHKCSAMWFSYAP